MTRTSETPLALVTGAGRRLGFELSRALLEAGYRVIATYRTHTEDIDTLAARGAEVKALALDDPESLDAFGAWLHQHHRQLDVLINNASGFEKDAGTPAERARHLQALLQVNTVAPYFLMEVCTPLLQQAHGASVINITDIFAEKPNPHFAGYCATKAALQNLTLSFARRLAPAVRVNAIMPGPIQFLPSHTAEQRAAVLAETPLGREGGFESVVRMALSLIDNDFVTGATIPVDGGRLQA
ncbi:SDR family oxidoreductase [Marinobacteraceae bacterium S3BR75-40.1]